LNVATLAAGSSCLLQANVTSTSASAYGNTTGAPTATGPVALTGSAVGPITLTVTGAVAPTVTKAFTASTLAVGSTTTLTITVQNTNAVALTSVAFTDTYPTSPAPITNSASANPTASPGTCTG